MVKIKANEIPHMKAKGDQPIAVIEVNDTYILGVYQGSLSDYDLLLRYRQKEELVWSRIRTPKHIHWAVDAIIKMHYHKRKTKNFLNFLIDLWDNQIKPLRSDEERNLLLDVDKLKEEANMEASKYLRLANKGEYSIEFLYLIAKLLMIQEKTNSSTAFMFKNLLMALKTHKDIYKIVSIATHRGR